MHIISPITSQIHASNLALWRKTSGNPLQASLNVEMRSLCLKLHTVGQGVKHELGQLNRGLATMYSITATSDCLIVINFMPETDLGRREGLTSDCLPGP